MIKVRNLSKSYGKLEVLKNISFDIERGKVYGFLGQNGAGKTTTMNILAGLIDFNGGEIFFNDIDFRKNKRELLSSVGYLPQNPVFYNYMNAYEYLNFIGEISGLPRSKIADRSDYLLDVVKLKASAKRKLGGYSGGMKQRMGIAAALLNEPEIVFMDEPTSALDPEGRLEVLELINSLKVSNTTVFLSTHILNDIERVCDKVSILDKGSIILSEELETLKLNYMEPIIDIEFENDCSDAAKRFDDIEAVKNTKIMKNRMSLYVNNINSSRNEILKRLADIDNPTVSLSLRKSTLEDIFIRLVNKHENL